MDGKLLSRVYHEKDFIFSAFVLCLLKSCIANSGSFTPKLGVFNLPRIGLSINKQTFALSRALQWIDDLIELLPSLFFRAWLCAGRRHKVPVRIHPCHSALYHRSFQPDISILQGLQARQDARRQVLAFAGQVFRQELLETNTKASNRRTNRILTSWGQRGWLSHREVEWPCWWRELTTFSFRKR